MATDHTAPLSDADVERLYDAPLDSFVSERAALVKRLRETGARDAAKQASALRKPTVPAWAVDQLARRHPEDLEALFRSNDRLREAQEEGPGGAARERFRRAVAERQRSLARLTDLAAAILVEAGHGDARATLDRVTRTLLAAATDEEGAARLRRGVLAQELEPASGFGELGVAPSPASARARTPTPKARRAPRRSDRPAPTGVRTADRRLEAARATADRLRADADRAEEAARDAEADAAATAQTALEAERAASKARTRAERSREAAQRAHGRAEEAAERAAGLEREMGRPPAD